MQCASKAKEEVVKVGRVDVSQVVLVDGTSKWVHRVGVVSECGSDEITVEVTAEITKMVIGTASSNLGACGFMGLVQNISDQGYLNDCYRLTYTLIIALPVDCWREMLVVVVIVVRGSISK